MCLFLLLFLLLPAEYVLHVPRPRVLLHNQQQDADLAAPLAQDTNASVYLCSNAVVRKNPERQPNYGPLTSPTGKPNGGFSITIH